MGTRLIIDGNEVYEIDEECLMNQGAQQRRKRQEQMGTEGMYGKEKRNDGRDHPDLGHKN